MPYPTRNIKSYECTLYNARNIALDSLTIWGLVFIVGNDNQADIFRIDDLLQKTGGCFKEEVVFKNYRMT